MAYTQGGKKWYAVTVKELKAFIACTLYMELKKLPNVYYHWTQSYPFMFCHVINQLFPKD